MYQYISLISTLKLCQKKLNFLAQMVTSKLKREWIKTITKNDTNIIHRVTQGNTNYSQANTNFALLTKAQTLQNVHPLRL